MRVLTSVWGPTDGGAIADWLRRLLTRVLAAAAPWKPRLSRQVEMMIAFKPDLACFRSRPEDVLKHVSPSRGASGVRRVATPRRVRQRAPACPGCETVPAPLALSCLCEMQLRRLVPPLSCLPCQGSTPPRDDESIELKPTHWPSFHIRPGRYGVMAPIAAVRVQPLSAPVLPSLCVRLWRLMFRFTGSGDLVGADWATSSLDDASKPQLTIYPRRHAGVADTAFPGCVRAGLQSVSCLVPASGFSRSIAGLRTAW